MTVETFPSAAIWVRPVGRPVYDHVVIVVEENKDYEQIIGSAAAPYINLLKKEGASFTKMYAEEHHSQGNYFWLFSGSNQGVGFYDDVPEKLFAAFCQENGIELVTIIDALEKNNQKRDLFFPKDRHLTARGNEVAAKVLDEKLTPLVDRLWGERAAKAP